MLLDQRRILAETAQNKTRRENDIRTSRGPGDYIAKNFTTNGKYQVEPESERGDEAASSQGGAARLGPAPACGVMSTGASILVDSVGAPRAEVCRTSASFP